MNISLETLKEAVRLKENIALLESKLAKILAGTDGAKVNLAKTMEAKAAGRKPLSAAGRARIIAAQKLRWAKARGSAPAAPVAKPAKKNKKGGLTAEGRARLAAIMKARWAKRKKAGGPPLNAPKKK